MARMFQFPTGWNSTRPFERFIKEQGSFNSQRDGILLFYSTAGVKMRFVSIPNGMEFYRTSYLKEQIESKFQFPTGWNSTLFINNF